MKNLILFLITLSLSASAQSAVLHQGHDQGNGGDGYALQFIGVAKRVVQYLKYSRTNNLNIEALESVIGSTRVESTYEPLFLNGLPKDAVNYPSEMRIIFNRARWDALRSGEKPALVLHEYLGIMGIEDANYRYSRALLNEFSVSDPRSGSSCVITGTHPVLHFTSAAEQKDEEYFTIETVTHKGVTFFLKAGHGVARLEAFMRGKLVANTFYSYGRSPAETDSLSLQVRNPRGEAIEAQCNHIDAYLPE